MREKKKSRQFSTRIFPHFVNTMALIDTVAFSVNGELAENYEQALVGSRDIGILRPGGGVFYSRCIFAKTRLTGNPVTIHHGRVKKFRNVPLMKITFRSEKNPVTAAEAIFLIGRLTSTTPEITVSNLELTYDITGVTFESLRRHMFHRAHRVTLLKDEMGRRTIYIGSPKSSHQVRVYEKNEDVIRIEFALRRSFLSRHGIHRPEDIALLRRLNIWHFFSLRRFSKTLAKKVISRKRSTAVREHLMSRLRRDRSPEELISILRRNRIDPRRVFRKTSLQEKLEAMQRRLVW